MSAADMTRVTWKRDWFPHLIGLTWCVVIANMVVSARTMAERDEAIRQRDDAQSRADRIEGALKANDEIRRFADFTTEPGQLFCIDRRDDLVVCVKNTKVTP